MARRHVASGKNSVSFELTGDIKAQLDAYADKVKATFRPACFAGATVLYDEMRLRAPVESGGLRDAIYRYRLREDLMDFESVFFIGVNHIKAPHWHFFELGTRKMAARPFIRPTYDAKIKQAAERAKEVIRERLK